MYKVLFVCSGNTCRSPMAERILQHKLAEKGLAAEIRADSAGIYALDGAAMSKNASAVLQKHALKTTDFKSKRLTLEIAQEADLILAMTTEHAAAIAALFPQTQEKLELLSEFSYSNGDIIDPFGSNKSYYEECFFLLEGLITKALPKILTLAKGEEA